MTPILETRGLSTGYRPARRAPVYLTCDLDATLHAGELVCLIGPNGAGKTTLLRTLAGLHPPIAGSILLAGQPLARLPASERARRIGVVLTERTAPRLMSGSALVALGRHPHTDWTGRLTAHDLAVVQRAVTAVGAGDYAARPLAEMSDGQRQKLWIARALAQEAQLILLDEPTAYLDLPRRVEIMRLLKELAHTGGCAILLSTHDLDLALRTADRIWLLSGGRMAIGAPEDLVLNGAFQAAFHSEGVVFDTAAGIFEMHARAAAPITLNGSGTAFVWTQRALERAGYTLSADAPLCVEVYDAHGAARWRLWRGAACAEFDSVYALIASL
jgi:iron complex transport system ATP-binding protein